MSRGRKKSREREGRERARVWRQEEVVEEEVVEEEVVVEEDAPGVSCWLARGTSAPPPHPGMERGVRCKAAELIPSDSLSTARLGVVETTE
ncbi:unnamed protein product [Lampetra fluviatilis]